MATRKPLVMVAGRIERLQAGDTIDADIAEVDLVELTNNNASPVVICEPVYIDGANTCDKAQADASGTMDVVALVKDASIASAAAGITQTDGVLSATTGQWDAITGESGGLTAGTIYYLSAATAGRLVEIAPTAVGQFVVQIGKAISTTEMEITIVDPIKL
jgi:hypothetical protein